MICIEFLSLTLRSAACSVPIHRRASSPQNQRRGREGRNLRMNYLYKYATRFATGMFTAALALSLAPVGRAQSAQQAPADSSASAASAAPAANTQQQLDDLQKEMQALEQQIAALKAAQNSAPTIQAASYQTPAPAPADTKVNLAGLLGPMTLSGVVDAYYGYNYNHPANNFSGWRFFDGPTNAFSLNMAEFVLDKAPDSSSNDARFGYHAAVGYGNAAAVVNGTDIVNFMFPPTTGANFYVKEAYGSYLAPVGKGLTLTVGKFVTPIGNEVIETSGNWNYSRGLLFYYAIPYFHFGASAKYAWNPKFAATFYLVNGWNNSAITHAGAGLQSSGLTYGISAAYTPNAKWSAIEYYFAGPNVTALNPNGSTFNQWKHISDTVISYTPNAKWAFALNGDYGFVQKSTPATKWWGVATYGKYTLNAKSYFAVRYEYYGDPQGFSGLLIPAAKLNGFGQEVTGTYSYNVTSGLQVRTEYRYDFASQPMFLRTQSKLLKEQNTATIGFIYSFSSANAK